MYNPLNADGLSKDTVQKEILVRKLLVSDSF